MLSSIVPKDPYITTPSTIDPFRLPTTDSSHLCVVGSSVAVVDSCSDNILFPDIVTQQLLWDWYNGSLSRSWSMINTTSDLLTDQWNSSVPIYLIRLDYPSPDFFSKLD